MSLTLGQRIFLAFSSLLILILGIAAGTTYYRGNKIAENAVMTALENIRTVQKGFEARRFQQLELISEIFASDPYFSSYVAEAAGGGLGLGGDTVDTESIVDQLIERQQDLGFDFAMVLNGEGEAIAHTYDRDIIGTNFSDDPLAGKVIDSLESATGYWPRNNEMFQVAVVPLADQQDLVGFLVTGLIVDYKFVSEIKNISGSELVLLTKENNQFNVVAGTLDLADQELLLSQDAMLNSAIGKDPVEIKLEKDIWLATVNNTDDNSSNSVMVALTSLDEASADFRAIENVLLIATAISIILAIPLSFFISRKVLAPVRQLAQASQAAARGDYQQSFKPSGKDELAHLTSAFDTLLSDLREKSDMQGYMTDLAKYLPDTVESKTSTASAVSKDSEAGKFVLLGIDLRRFTKEADKKTPEEVFALMNASLQNIDSLAIAYGGYLIGVLGHRLIIAFKGQDDYKRALSMGGSVLSTLMSQEEGVAVAVTDGHAVFGTALLGDAHIKNILGSTVFQLSRLLGEAVADHVFISPGILERIREEKPNFEPVSIEGSISKSNFYCLSIDDTHQFEVDVDVEGNSFNATQITKGSASPKRIHIVPGMSLGGRYEIISELGSGGMGVVYKAHDHELDDLVALKMLRIKDQEGSEGFLESLKSEIVLARKITHPAVLRTYDYGELDDVPYISMEYVRGLTLKYLLQQSQKMPYSAGIRIAKQLAGGLQAAHDQGVYHRDIKPENVILENSGNAKIMDFGIARKITAVDSEEMKTGIIGTPRYAAPEQLLGYTIDATADIYSAGVLIYHMYTGRFPFIAQSVQRLIKVKTEEEPTPPSKYWKAIPVELEEIIMKCIAAQPEDRIQSAGLLLDELEKLRA